MSIRKHPTKKGFYQIIVSQGAKGKQLVYPVECSEADAMILDQQINAQIKGEKLSIFPTITQALPQYLTYYETIATPDIVKDFASVMRRELLPQFGRYPAQQIIATQVYAYTNKRLKDGVTHRTIEKELNYLSAMCRWLHVNGMAEKMPLIPKPPKSKTQPKKKPQAITLEELERLTNSVPADKLHLLLLMSDAGLRVSEALNVFTEDVDLTGGRVTVVGKGGKIVIYPILTNRLQAALENAKAAAGPNKYLTVNKQTEKPYGSIKTLLRLATKRADIKKHITHHTLRHTFSTLLMESGISTEARRRLMRHSSLAATEHYTHTSPEYLEREAGGFTRLINASESLKVK